VFHSAATCTVGAGRTLPFAAVGTITGPADNDDDERIEVQFDALQSKIDMHISTIDRKQPDPNRKLVGGFKMGDQLYFTGTGRTYASGDRLDFGMRGEVLGPGGDDRLQMRFPGHKGTTQLTANELSRTEPTVPGGFRIKETLYYVAGLCEFKSGDKVGRV